MILIRVALNTLQNTMLSKNKVPHRNLLIITNKGEKETHEIYQDILDSRIYKIIGYSNSKKVEGV